MWAAKKYLIPVAVVIVGSLFSVGSASAAINPIPTPSPESNSYGLEATKKQPAPTTGATITVPGSGATFTTSPVTVSGICPNDLLVQVYNNGVMAGSTICKGGSFSLQISLYAGQNELSASVFDSLDQTGPDSNKVSVTYNPNNFTAFSSLVTLTSAFGRRAANPGSTLTWPLQLSGGSGPYAFSIDWGDGKPSELKSQGVAGVVDIEHVYSKAGIYNLTVRVTDANGVSAFLQLVAIANGQVSTTGTTDTTQKTATTVTKVLWLPAAVGIILAFPAFWLGRRSELVALRHKLEKDAASYKDL
jgi:hypothetical protein